MISLTSNILNFCHDPGTPAHSACRQPELGSLSWPITEKFRFPDVHLSALVQQLCRARQVCQQNKPKTGKQHGEPEIYPVPDEPFTSLAIDFVDLPKTEVNGDTYDYLMS